VEPARRRAALGQVRARRDDKAEGEGRRAKLDFPRTDKALAFDLVEAMRPMAESRGVAVSAIALAWLLHKDVVSSVIVGARRRTSWPRTSPRARSS
jgi:aryl-alcohol dehydrogenase-like predicted oxidoreductase